MVFAPRFSPSGDRVAFSVERAGNTDIFVMNLRNHGTSRITSDPSIDTSPSFSPDGSRMVFNSDRGGTPQLYTMNADGSGVRRISLATSLYRAAMTGLRDAAREVAQHGSFGYLDRTIVTPDLNAYLKG